MKGKDVAFLGIMTALSLCLSFVESLLPAFVAIPGVKIGLANLVVVFVLYKLDFKKALLISLLRVLLSCVLFSNFLALIYSLSGALVSLVVMALLKKTQLFSTIAVSVSGGVFHNVAQVVVACLILNTSAIKYYIPVLLISGILSGALIGFIAALLLNRFGFNER